MLSLEHLRVSPALDRSRAFGLGGAIFNLNGVVTLRFSTLAGNTVLPAGFAQGGAVYSPGDNLQSGQAASLTLSNSILANTVSGPDLLTLQLGVATATLTYQDENIVMSTVIQGGAGSSGPAPLTSDPQLAALALNAPGLTPTMAIGTGSPAFNAGVCETSITSVDQRGVPRPQGAACDIGAYELIQNVAVTIVSAPAGLAFSVSGSSCQAGNYTGGTILAWQVGSSCSVSFASPQSGGAGTQYVFSSWADGGSTANPRTFTTRPARPPTRPISIRSIC